MFFSSKVREISMKTFLEMLLYQLGNIVSIRFGRVFWGSVSISGKWNRNSESEGSHTRDQEQLERTGKTLGSKQELTVATWDVDFQTDHKIQAKTPYCEQKEKK